MNEEELTKKMKENGISTGDEVMAVLSEGHSMKGRLEYNPMYNGFFVRNRHGMPVTIQDIEVNNGN